MELKPFGIERMAKKNQNVTFDFGGPMANLPVPEKALPLIRKGFSRLTPDSFFKTGQTPSESWYQRVIPYYKRKQ
jgi:hypothetical protein